MKTKKMYFFNAILFGNEEQCDKNGIVFVFTI